MGTSSLTMLFGTIANTCNNYESLESSNDEYKTGKNSEDDKWKK